MSTGAGDVSISEDKSFSERNEFEMENENSDETEPGKPDPVVHFALPERMRRKAKRPSKYLQKLEMGIVQAAGTGEAPDGVGIPESANKLERQARHMSDRKSRSGKGRGLPKKGGAGGKGVWGKPGCELADTKIDQNDPNYDSGDENSNEVVVEEISPELSVDEVHKEVQDVILEYFEHGDSHEVTLTLGELNFGENKNQVVYKIISVAMDHKGTQRELSSRTIADLYGTVLSQDDIMGSFDQLLRDLPDLTLDTPDAPQVLGNFIARAIADDCLPPKFVHNYKGKVDNSHASQSLEKAEVLMSMKHGMVRLDNVWGIGGGIRPVKILVKKMVLLLKEYQSSGDIAEATRCLLELEVPHFHHELVYEAIILVLEDGTEKCSTMMAQLLKSLYDAVIITPVQLATGFHRATAELSDLSLDIPNAETFLERFAVACQKLGILTKELMQECTSRGRKRFISEGDGGRVKEVPIIDL